MFQIVEKDDFGTDWHLIRYDDASVKRFNTEAEANDAAKKYINKANDTSLCALDRQSGSECFMATEKGFFLGFQDNGEDWYMIDGKKNITKDRHYHELEGKTEVKVRLIPGT